MKIAVISDIHSNYPALKAVIKDIQKHNVKKIFCCGDLVGYAPFPNEVIKLIKDMEIACIRGNYDDTIGFGKLVCGCDFPNEQAQALGEQSIAWTLKNTSVESKQFLTRLPEQIHFCNGRHDILFVHGSPDSLTEYLYEDTPIELVDRYLEEHHANILVCGHIHKPYWKKTKRGVIVNAGSVGKPKDGTPDATYTIISLNEEVAVEFHKVGYDVEFVCRAIVKAGLPEEFARQLREGRGW